MEFFIPGLFLFLVSVTITFILVPRFTPLVIALLSVVFLTYGIYDHYKMFANEYRLSTWQQSLKIYAPAIMIIAIILFIIVSILSFFTKGSVPVPVIPMITEPNENTTTDKILNGLNKIGNIFTNNNTNIVDKVNNKINNVNKNRTNLFGLGNTDTDKDTDKKNNKKNNNGLSRSFLETI